MQTIKHKQHGRSWLMTVFLIPALLIGSAVAYFLFCEARKAYWDHQVKVMCEKDGGVRVYDKDIISQTLYEQLGGQQGEIPIYSKHSAPRISPYFKKEETMYLRTENPQVRRSETHFKKRQDNQTLAVYVYYARVGGDFPTIAHHSSYGCPYPEGGLTKQFIQIAGKEK